MNGYDLLEGLGVFSSTFLGGCLVIISLTVIIYNRRAGTPLQVPMAFYPLTIAILFEVGALLCLETTPSSLLLRRRLAFESVSFVCVIISLVLIRRSSGPGRRTIFASSILLALFGAIGVIGVLGGSDAMYCFGWSGF